MREDRIHLDDGDANSGFFPIHRRRVAKRVEKKLVIPAKAGIQIFSQGFVFWTKGWIPAFAGMTNKKAETLVS